jgi:uncharacterized protein YbaP (TraB family)
VWQIRSPESKRVSYLVGSLHMLTDADKTLPRVITDTYQLCDHLVFEVDTKTMTTNAWRRLFTRLACLPPEQHMERWLDAETSRRLHEYLDLSNRSTSRYEKLRPWYLAVTLLNEEYARYGGRDEFGVESQLQQMARRDGKRSSGLETPEDQYQLFSRMDRETEVKFLQMTLDEIGEVETFFDELRKEWRKGNLKALEQLLFREDQGYEKIFDLLIQKRNLQWMETIRSLPEKYGTAMIVVGVGHLVGENGLPSLLKERGFEVERMPLRSN